MKDGIRFRKTPDSLENSEAMPKGQKLIFIDGPWCRVSKDGEIGYVDEDFLAITSPEMDSEGAIQFNVGHANASDSENTITVRKIIHDEFGFGKIGDCLNCVEYVQFRVKTKLGLKINWPVKIGRDGGKWADIFQAAGAYKVLNFPQDNCAMCFTDNVDKDAAINALGHVAFVESVLPDGSVEISEANWPGDGKYNERLITTNQWRKKYKAKFIKFD